MAPITRSQTRRLRSDDSAHPPPPPPTRQTRRPRRVANRVIRSRVMRPNNPEELQFPAQYLPSASRSQRPTMVASRSRVRRLPTVSTASSNRRFVPRYLVNEAHVESDFVEYVPHRIRLEPDDDLPIYTRTRGRLAEHTIQVPAGTTPIHVRRQATPIYIQARRHAVSAIVSRGLRPTSQQREAISASMEAVLRVFQELQDRNDGPTGRIRTYISVDEMMDNLHNRHIDIIDPNEISEDDESDAEASTSAVVEPEPKKRRGRAKKGGKGRGRAKSSDDPVRTPALAACTICCEDIPKRPVACRYCRQPIGCRYCVKKWFRTTNLSHLDARPPFAMSVSHRNHHSCPLCRAPWGDNMEIVRVVNEDGIPFSQKDVSMDAADVPGPSQVATV